MGQQLDTLTEVTVPATMRWLYDTIAALVEDESSIFVETAVADTAVTFTVKIAQEDLGKVIGKQGRTARALRTLLCARGGKDGVRYVLDLPGRVSEAL